MQNTEKKKAAFLERATMCYDKFTFKDLDSNMEIKVLAFYPHLRADLTYWPDFVIGITESNDTIGIIDKNFDGKIKKMDKALVLPATWDNYEVEHLHPPVLINKKKHERELYCKVKLVYRGCLAALN
jgi:hypothetical protein